MKINRDLLERRAVVVVFLSIVSASMYCFIKTRYPIEPLEWVLAIVGSTLMGLVGTVIICSCYGLWFDE